MNRKFADGIVILMAVIGFLIYGLLILNPDIEIASSMIVVVTKAAVGGVLILATILIGLTMRSNDASTR